MHWNGGQSDCLHLKGAEGKFSRVPETPKHRKWPSIVQSGKTSFSYMRLQEHFEIFQYSSFTAEFKSIDNRYQSYIRQQIWPHCLCSFIKYSGNFHYHPEMKVLLNKHDNFKWAFKTASEMFWFNNRVSAWGYGQMPEGFHWVKTYSFTVNKILYFDLT